jgi:chromosomal replication initiator protein
MSIAELKSKNNSRDVVAARQIAMYLTRQLTQMSLSEIGRRFGGKHHTTVIYAVRQIIEQSQSDKILRTTLAELQEALSRQTSLTDCSKKSINVLHL